MATQRDGLPRRPGRQRLPTIRPSASTGCHNYSGEMSLLSAYLALVAFFVGIWAPCFTMIPRLGGGSFETVVRWFVRDSLEPKQVSLAGGILHLFHEGEYLIGGLLLIFSIVFPLTKLAAVLVLVHADRETAQPLLGVLPHLGKFSMLDVFVIASVVICFKSFPGGSRIEIEWGLYVFAASVILSMVATYFLKRHMAHCT